VIDSIGVDAVPDSQGVQTPDPLEQSDILLETSKATQKTVDITCTPRGAVMYQPNEGPTK
jgi:hypothetical protein